MKKYDDELTGWDATYDIKHDLIFTTIDTRVYKFNECVEKQVASGKVTFERNLSILHATRSEQNNSFFVIRKDHGKLSNEDVDELLSEGKAVNKMHIINEMNQMKFVDSEPPTPYTMMIVWDHVLKTFLDEKQKRDLAGNKTVLITATIDEIYQKLKHFAPLSNPECIKKVWVRRAIDGFREIGSAKLVDEPLEKFEIKFRHRKDGVIDRLFKKANKTSRTEPSKTLDEFLTK